MGKVTVAYSHDPAKLDFVWLAVVPSGTTPTDKDWLPALRDLVRGKRVVWARFPDSVALVPEVWLRDRDSAYKVIPLS